METFKKIIYVINTFVLFIISTLLMIAMLIPKLAVYLGIYSDFSIISNPYGRLWEIIAVWCIFCFSFLGVVLVFTKRTGFSAINKTSEIGVLKITIKAIENIAYAEARKISGLKISKAIVARNGDGVNVLIKASTQLDENIPELSSEIQTRVKEAIEKSAEVNVIDVKVVIVDIFAQNKPRVE